MTRHVMLIEDEPNITEALRFILHRDGWQVSALADGAVALAEVAARRPDVVILDLMLPGVSGLDILRGLRANPATSTLPVMMLTAKGQGRDREAAEQAGVTCFMTKPFSNAEIIARLRDMVPA